MKQHSFTTRLKSLAVVFGIALTFTSCANEDVAQNPTNPNEDNDKNLTTFVAGDETKTRTSMDHNSGDFYWEEGDHIYVKDDDGVWQRNSNAPTGKVASFKFKVPGKFTASTNYKVYYLGKYGWGKMIAISNEQTQTAPDNTEHFGTSGDYGTATATKITGKQQFQFTLEHQPAYLVFQPYTNSPVLHNCYLTKIEVISDNDIAESYRINTSTDNLDAFFSGKQIVLETKSTSGAYINGFPLTNNAASRTTNGAYMVIKPGTHTLKVRYWVKDLVTEVEGAITKSLPSTNYASNTYYDVTANLNVHDYDGDHYYMWDAQDQYWKGHEWNKGGSQPTLNYYTPGSAPSSDLPQSGDTRYYNTTYPGYGMSYSATHASCKDLPNVNEMTWYAAKGEPRWDADELWTTMGHLYRGGMWFKKKAYISGYNKNTAVDGVDWRPISTSQHWSVSFTLPSATEISNYFYLPALGYYMPSVYPSQPSGIGSAGSYWSSSAWSGWSDYAYCLDFGPHDVYVNGYQRGGGMRVDLPFE